MSLTTLMAAIIADGMVDAGEVAQLKEQLLADGVISTAEVVVLFRINDVTEGNDPAFQELFVESVAANILADGEIDDEEVAMLVALIGDDVDATEAALLAKLAEAGPLPEALAALVPAEAA